ncbi:MAG TPA: hypothetical protein VFK87_04270, partial [Steroidobacteraceae bacterium]|nr:hypothetical protein [Steroidobacteraceae bacterium]
MINTTSYSSEVFQLFAGTSAEPAVAAPTVGAPGTAARAAAPRLRFALLALAVALTLLIALLAAYELAAARV